MKHEAQIESIKEKWVRARKADSKLEVFGADLHKYRLNPPVWHAEVGKLEEQYSISLPDCYREFLLCFSNGGAGPYYGLYRLEENYHMDAAGLYLKELPVIAPETSDEVWAALIGRLEDIPDEEEEQYFRERFRIFSGILAIGSQGCRYEHAIVLNGTHKGRVVNINDDLLTKSIKSNTWSLRRKSCGFG